MSVPCLGEEPDSNFAWEVVGEEGSVFIAGSIHFMPEDTFPLSGAVEEAFEASEALVVQANLLEVDQEELNNYYRKKGFYEGDKTLSSSLSEKTFKHLEKVLADINLPLSGVDQFKPWHLAQTLETQKVAGLDYELDLSVELYFMEKAREEEKEIIELETFQEQLNLVKNFPPDLQEKYLLATLLEFEKDNRLTNILQAWKEGDKGKMENNIFGVRKEHEELEEYYQKFYDERNVKMVDQIETFLEKERQVFIVLKAGHLVGENSVLNLLREKGYQLEQL